MKPVGEAKGGLSLLEQRINADDAKLQLIFDNQQAGNDTEVLK